MIWTFLPYVIVSLILLIASWRAAPWSIGVLAVTFGALSIFFSILPPPQAWPLLRAFAGGVLEEILRSGLLARARINTAAGAVSLGTLFAGFENIQSFAPAMDHGRPVALSTLNELYVASGQSELLTFGLLLQPFFRLCIHICLLYLTIDALRRRAFFSAAGLILGHGALNLGITYGMTRELRGEVLVGLALFTGLLAVLAYRCGRGRPVGIALPGR